MEIYCHGRFQKLGEVFFVKRVVYFWNKLPNDIKDSNSVKNDIKNHIKMISKK